MPIPWVVKYKHRAGIESDICVGGHQRPSTKKVRTDGDIREDALGKSVSTENLAFLGTDTEWKRGEKSLLRGPHPEFIFQTVRPGSLGEKSQGKKYLSNNQCLNVPSRDNFQILSRETYSKHVCVSCIAGSDSFQPHGLRPTRLLCPWDSPGKNIGVHCHFLLQGFFPTQGSNPGLPHYRQILYRLTHQGSPIISIGHIKSLSMKSQA